jgi:hypothetical protein
VELIGTNGADNLTGSIGHDILMGLEGADLMRGGDGMDWLAGGPGADVLTGGNGADVFSWSSLDLDGSVDRITDFAVGQDQLDLVSALNGYNQQLSDISSFLSVTTSNNDAVIWIDIQGGGNFSRFVLLENLAGVSLNELVSNGSILA